MQVWLTEVAGQSVTVTTCCSALALKKEKSEGKMLWKRRSNSQVGHPRPMQLTPTQQVDEDTVTAQHNQQTGTSPPASSSDIHPNNTTKIEMEHTH